MSDDMAGLRSSFQGGGRVNRRFSPVSTETKDKPTVAPTFASLPSDTMIHLPSGDQDRNRTSDNIRLGAVNSATRRSTPFEAEGIRRRSALSLDKRRNAMVRPSGDQAGLRSALGSVVNRKCRPSPICFT